MFSDPPGPSGSLRVPPDPVPGGPISVGGRMVCTRDNKSSLSPRRARRTRTTRSTRKIFTSEPPRRVARQGSEVDESKEVKIKKCLFASDQSVASDLPDVGDLRFRFTWNPPPGFEAMDVGVTPRPLNSTAEGRGGGRTNHNNLNLIRPRLRRGSGTANC